ncbi:sporulation inhibitor of replication protein SirA [Cytobacillus sp. FSL W7-1323]|uniref:Sporulation inhibitor of replication protein SirA n=1 Tax=Cytobacillus kochii TaxID=859143 RepID=A0A248TCH2_9BACI|nr:MULTISPECIES: sporulation inhibitor of replication protein SirA [Cytobacillus]ASV65856.1 hypothetical protein CKF48_00085 [Cytobacillus kochii]MCA1025770.1 sporulation inhibitor of replication protein SirA [Cytobacillus kochii]MCM3321606.1 sporulation inhibitor of replication protein SirA [Cytobacillus kochii]MCM3343560.1 sporulation inhibitor of replication protein SirA [Cytobacillus kochii]MDM5207391.1 sporulation inhibitor of replication protein SirA [Cytobacillus kochii]
MRTYQLYLIDEPFASHYFGREQMFYQLFKEYEQATGTIQFILGKQIAFITKNIPKDKVNNDLYRELYAEKKVSYKSNAFYIKEKNSQAKLMIYDRFLSLEAQGNYDAETVFFEVLRKEESSYLAIDLFHNRFGWLKPIKERKFV